MHMPGNRASKYRLFCLLARRKKSDLPLRPKIPPFLEFFKKYYKFKKRGIFGIGGFTVLRGGKG